MIHQASPQLKTIYVENFEPGVTAELIYKHIAKYPHKTIQLNKQNQYATIEFNTEETARQALLNLNCKPFLKRPVKMSFKCEKGKEMAEFFLTGLDKADLNKIYGIGSKFGKSCKFSFNMTEKAKNSADKAKVVSHGYISITDFDNSNLEQLKKELRDEGVTCEPYNKQEEKSTVKIENFAPNFTDEVDLLNKIKEYKELVNAEVRKQCNFNDSEFTTGIHVDKVGGQNVARATVAFDKKENAIRFYDVITPIASEIFKGFKPIITIRTSYKSETLDNLIGFNIKVPEGKVQEYERDILEALKKINDGIVAASVREIKKKEDAGALNKTSTWMLHITLKSEDDGKELMANYLQGEAKKILQPFFNGEPFLNIFCSAAFRKEFKKAKSNWKPFEKRIKNAQDATKKFDFETRMKAPRFPPAMQPMQFPPYRGPNMPSMGVPPIMPPMGVNPSMMMQFGMANPMVPRPADSEARKQQFLRDKDDPTKNPVTMKKVASSLIIVALEEMNFKDSRKIAATLCDTEEFKNLCAYIENNELLRKKAEQIMASFNKQ